VERDRLHVCPSSPAPGTCSANLSRLQRAADRVEVWVPVFCVVRHRGKPNPECPGFWPGLLDRAGRCRRRQPVSTSVVWFMNASPSDRNGTRKSSAVPRGPPGATGERAVGARAAGVKLRRHPANRPRPGPWIPCAGAQGRRNLETEWSAQFLAARENCVTPESFFCWPASRFSLKFALRRLTHP